ncbi:SGNH/GDSL hydrolase family protein [Brevifollis gellanilyticus]|uniref:SGNH hydrolase-type esterase domain-containing protein n=1 Tax=Brevifollis gellanilyticus TaxID=748831 RepID=A0A512MA49_9BACT|nr:SGNH/GDSL hydrolase family protein [Brevifollis gellanilyticus]GEP43615.1 hypothetical protein BGE01nite_29060 [Brevifollis gellanilyticus]
MNLRRFSLVVFTTLLSLSGASPAAEGKPLKMLFVGNSITRHGPAAKIGWTGNWGMAATSEDKDYVHLVVDAVTKKQGAKPEFLVANVADFERNFETFDFTTKLKTQTDFAPDIVVLAIGENVPALQTEESKTKFKDSVTKLMTLLKASPTTKIYVRGCFWANPAKDTSLKEACATVGGTFIDISSLAKDEANYARSERKIEHEGVARHPGDKGMQAIADAISASIVATLK